MEIYLTKTIPQELPEGFEIPMDELPRSHRGGETDGDVLIGSPVLN